MKFKTFDNIAKYFSKNIQKINNDKIRRSAQNVVKASHLEMIDVTKGGAIFKMLIVKSEAHKVSRHKATEHPTELQNRKAGKKLIDKTSCRLFVIDNYLNRELKQEITEYAKTKGKSVIFAISSEYQGLMLADIF